MLPAPAPAPASTGTSHLPPAAHRHRGSGSRERARRSARWRARWRAWTGDPALSKAALRAEDARANKEVGALIEEVAALPGMPEKHVQSTEKKWVDFAVSQGLS